MGELVEEYRKAKGWSQREAARQLGIHNSYIALIETGQRSRISKTIAQKLSEQLSIPLSKLQPYTQSPNIIPSLQIVIRGTYPGRLRKSGNVISGMVIIPATSVGEAMQDMFALEVIGDALLSENIKDGHYLIVSSRYDFKAGELYVLSDDSELSVKRLEETQDSIIGKVIYVQPPGFAP